MKKIIRVSTVPISLDVLLKGQLKFLNEFFEIVALSSPGKSLEIVHEREGVRVESINMERKISVFKDLISLIKLIKFFKKEKPDIVHSITPKAGLLSMIAAFIVGCPVRIHTFTGLVFPTERGIKKMILIFMDKLLCSCSTKIIPEGQGVKNDLINYKITSKELKILGNGNVNGIDLEYFKPSSDFIQNSVLNNLKIKETDFVFVFVGRIVKDKGIQELVESFRKLNIENPNCKLILVGEIEKGHKLPLKVVEEINNSTSILSVGFQNDIRPFLSIANVFVLPSYREGFPNSVLQAGAMGIPSIVTNVNGSNEIIVNGYNGLIIEKKSAEELLKTMRLVSNGGVNLLELGKNSRIVIEEKFNRAIIWEELKTEYEKY